MTQVNADPHELAKFSALAHRWWDPSSEFRPLHEINPLRLNWIDATIGLSGKRALDVGCGGGILTESMAARQASVTGVDLSEKALSVARLHLYESGLKVEYRLTPVETLAEEQAESFDVVTCMEMLEHVPNPASVISACAKLVRTGGHVFFSTLNRNIGSYLQAVIGAEYVLNMLPKGTHDYEKFITPAELAKYVRDAGLLPVDLVGVRYNPLTKVYSLGKKTSVNYMLRAVKPV